MVDVPQHVKKAWMELLYRPAIAKLVKDAPDVADPELMGKILFTFTIGGLRSRDKYIKKLQADVEDEKEAKDLKCGANVYLKERLTALEQELSLLHAQLGEETYYQKKCEELEREVLHLKSVSNLKRHVVF